MRLCVMRCCSCGAGRLRIGGRGGGRVGPAATWAVWIALGIPQTAAAQTEPAAAAEAETPPESEDDTDSTVLHLGDIAVLDFDGRLHVLWRLSDEPDAPLNEFALNSVRLQASWRQGDWLDAVLELEAEEALQSGSASTLLRDAYVKLTALPWLEVRAGQLKRSFSRLELLPRRRLPTIDRGPANRWNVRRLGYGDRDVGLELGGRLWEDGRLDYAIGVFNGEGAGLAESGISGFKDLSARLEMRPIRWLSFGLSFSLDTREESDLPHLVDPAIFAEVDPAEFPAGYTEDDFRREHAWMAGTSWMGGADVGVQVEGLRLYAEALFGDNWWFEGEPYTTSVTLLASYEMELSSDWAIRLEPVVRGELVVPRIESLDSRVWFAVVGVNLHVGSHVRVMVDGEFIRVEGAEPDEVARKGLWPGEWPGGWESVNRLSVQLAFDL